MNIPKKYTAFRKVAIKYFFCEEEDVIEQAFASYLEATESDPTESDPTTIEYIKWTKKANQ